MNFRSLAAFSLCLTPLLWQPAQAQAAVPVQAAIPLQAAVPSQATVLSAEQSLAGEHMPGAQNGRGRLIAGYALLGVGGVGVLGGTVAYSVLSAAGGCAGDAPCVDPARTGKGISLVSLVLGGAMVAVAIPLISSAGNAAGGDSRNRERALPASVVPELKVGLGSATFSLSF